MKPANMTVSFAPHIQDSATVNRLMLDVIIALVPALIAAVYVFQMQAAIIIGVCVVSCVFFEWAFSKITKRKNTIGDLSAVVTGLLFSLLLPENVLLWHAVLGCFIAVVFVKGIFGGLGKNFANPAITAHVVLIAAFPAAMTTWTTWVSPFWSSTVTAKPFANLMNAGYVNVPALPDFSDLSYFDFEMFVDEMQMFIGTHSGILGEAMPAAILLGGLYLLFRRVISWHIPVVIIGVVFLLTAIAGYEPVFQVFAGGLLLGAFFMACDPSTSPMSAKRRIIFAVIIGLHVTQLRLFVSFPEAISYSILLANLLVPLINKFSARHVLGEVRGKS